MKKAVLCLVLFIIAPAMMMAQASLKLYDTSNNDITSSTVDVWADSTQQDIVADVYVKNTNSNALDVKVKRIENSTVSGTMNAFCWTQCYSPATNVSPQSITISSGQTVQNFIGHYYPAGITGVTTITYVFFDASNTSDSSYVVVNYHVTATGINEQSLAAQSKISDAYPNPANTFVKLNYKVPQVAQQNKVVIYNMLGEEVKTIDLPKKSGVLTIPVEELNSGVYFYSLSVNNKRTVTKRFVITH